MNVQPEVPSERVAIIVFLLCKGRKFTTNEVAELCGVTRRGARRCASGSGTSGCGCKR
jgi:hypothetical protein